MKPVPARGSLPRNNGGAATATTKGKELSLARAPAQYLQERQQAYRLAMEIEQREREFSRQRQHVIQQMDAEFRLENAPLYDEYEQAEQAIAQEHGTALKMLKEAELRVLCDRSASYEEKMKRIKDLRASFRETYHPDDAYERHTRENSIESLLGAFFGGLAGGPTVHLLGAPALQASAPPSARRTATRSSTPRIEEI